MLGLGNMFGGREYILCLCGIFSVFRVGLFLLLEVFLFFIFIGIVMLVMVFGKLIWEKNNN